SLRDQRVSSIEICADIETDRPDADFRRLLPWFKERFCRVRFQGYNTAVWYGELWHDCNSVRGYLSTGVSFKLYVKTNRRLRLEVEYTREGLSRVRLPTDAPQIRPPGVQLPSEANRRAPVTLDAHELVPLWHFLAAHCLPQMNAILQRARIVPTYHWTPEHLLSVIAPVFSHSSRAELETLIGAVT